MSPGFATLEGKRWGKEKRGKKKGKVGRNEGKEKRNTKSAWAPTGARTPAGSLSRPPSSRRGHRVAGDWRRKIGHTA